MRRQDSIQLAVRKVRTCICKPPNFHSLIQGARNNRFSSRRKNYGKHDVVVPAKTRHVTGKGKVRAAR